LGMVEPWFLGGDPEEGSGGTYDDLELEIEPYSVGRMSEERRALMQQELDQIILTIAPAMVQLPHVNWKRYLQMRGESAGIPDLDKLIIPEVAQMLAGLNLQMQAQPQGELAGTRGAAGFAPRPATTRPSGAPLPQPSVGGGGFRGGRERPQPKLPAGQGVKMLGGKGGGGGAAV
ncbi:MAG TPA: hypothetical protein VF653_10370, partial [Methylomirabilota bacterium]